MVGPLHITVVSLYQMFQNVIQNPLTTFTGSGNQYSFSNVAQVYHLWKWCIYQLSCWGKPAWRCELASAANAKQYWITSITLQKLMSHYHAKRQSFYKTVTEESLKLKIVRKRCSLPLSAYLNLVKQSTKIKLISWDKVLVRLQSYLNINYFW